MRKILLTVFSFALLSAAFIWGNNTLAAPNSNEALDQLKAAGGTSGANIAGSGPTDPRMLAAIIIRASLAFVGIIFVVLIVYAGFLWMTAGGEEEKTSKAKKLIYNAVIGLIIVMSAYALTSFIVSRLVGATTGSSPYADGSGLPPPPNP